MNTFDRPPRCPDCGEPLTLAGGVVDTGRFKRWVDRWVCATHGTVQPAEATEARSWNGELLGDAPASATCGPALLGDSDGVPGARPEMRRGLAPLIGLLFQVTPTDKRQGEMD